jgi:LysM repeat protein
MLQLLLSLIFLGLAVDAGAQHHRFVRRATALTSPDKPTQTGTISTCNRWYDVISGDSCYSVETTFGITHAQFLSWNPAVSSDCTQNFWVGDSYCVGIGSGTPVSTTSSSSMSTARKTAATTGPDMPTQSGISSQCNAWYDVVSGDTCSAIEGAFNVTHAQFLLWNPAVSSDCASNFWVGNSYCVGISDQTTTSSSQPTVTTPYSTLAANTTSYAPTTTDSSWPPSRTQAGQPTYCKFVPVLQPQLQKLTMNRH